MEKLLKSLRDNNWSMLLIGVPEEDQDKLRKLFDETYIVQEQLSVFFTLAVIRRLFQNYSKDLNVEHIVEELDNFERIFDIPDEDKAKYDYDEEAELISAFEIYYIELMKYEK